MSWFRDIFNRIRRPLYISTGALGADSTRKLSDYTTELEKFGDTLNPSFPLEFIPLIKRMALIYPDVSQAVKRSVLLGNTGLKFRLEGASDQVQEQAQLEIKNWLAEYPGIINKLFRQVVMTGAVSCECIPSIDLKSVEELRLIPVEDAPGT